MIDLSHYKNIHCIGIGGIGLSAIAEILLSRGYNVTGSDMKESDMTANLAGKGARIFIGHRAENVADADLIVIRRQWAGTIRSLKKRKKKGFPPSPEQRCWEC